jgi:lipopolysaccharide transport system permease protein
MESLPAAGQLTETGRPAAPTLDIPLATAPAMVRQVIEPARGWQPLDLAELWRFRELLYFLVWRDVKVRYKQTVLGASWAVLQPVMTMIVFTVFFGRLGGMAQYVEGSYTLFVFAGLLPWQFFSNAVMTSGQSLVNSGNLITKVYFPRLLVPASATGGYLVDFGVSLAVMALMLIWEGQIPGVRVLALPVLILWTVMTAIGTGALFSALVIEYRDFRHVLSFIIQLWMFASPVAYPTTRMSESVRLIYAINPMVGIISGYRSVLLGSPWEPGCVVVSAVSSILIFLLGLTYFRKTERRFADIV